jgi:bifunctional ADP-heptose synthase (sugar kinase/adenylyltransferase)
VTLRQRIDYDKPLSGQAREELAGEFRMRCPAKVDVAILADHGLGSIGPESLGLIGLAKDRRARLVAIPRTSSLRGQPLDAIVINSPEIRQMSGGTSDADPKTLAARYAREYAQTVFLTMLEEGILVCPSGTASAGTLIKGYPCDSFQWMGARDMATAVIALGLALDLDPVSTGQLANAFRHLVACQRGNGRVLWRDVFRFVGLEG